MDHEKELLRYKAVYEHLLDQQVVDHGSICRIWPTLTRIPVRLLERAVYDGSDVSAALYSRAKGTIHANYLQPDCVRAEIRAIPYATAPPSQPEEKQPRGFLGCLGLAPASPHVKVNKWPPCPAWDKERSSAENMLARIEWFESMNPDPTTRQFLAHQRTLYAPVS